MWDYFTPLEQTMEALHHAAVQSGKARAIGIANCHAWQLEKANAVAREHGWTEFVCVQNHYNLIFREEEQEMLPCCRAEGIATTPYSPLASGRLSRQQGQMTKRLTEDTFAKSKYDRTAAEDRVIEERVLELAKKRVYP